MQLGIKPLPEALAIAKELDLDLVEVAPMANPPVCRIMDFGKFKFDEAQRAKESRRKAVHVGIKEMKYRPKIGPGDFDTKTRQVAKFLDEGHKVKITIMFRGREVYHPEHGKRILDRIAEQMEGVAKVEAEPKLDNRNMIMVLAPDKRARQAAQSRANQQRTEKPGASCHSRSGGRLGSRGRGGPARRPPPSRGTDVGRQPVRPTGSAKSQHQPKRDDAMPKMKTTGAPPSASRSPAPAGCAAARHSGPTCSRRRPACARAGSAVRPTSPRRTSRRRAGCSASERRASPPRAPAHTHPTDREI